MKWKRLVESNDAPSDKKTIDGVFSNGDFTKEKYVPTVEFVRETYNKLNRELFSGSLIYLDDFKVEHRGLEFTGCTECHDVKNGEFEIDCIVLNSSINMTLHSWMEVVLHEMIHVLDLTENPEHYRNKEYDPHGDWFMKQAKRFEKMGFNVTSKYAGDFEDEDGFVFIKLCDNPLGFSEMVKIPNSEKSEAFNRLFKHGYRSVSIMKTGNPDANRLKYSIYDDDFGYSVYHANNKFNDNFGPFEKVETVELGEVVKEADSKCETLYHGCVKRTPRPGGGYNYSIR